MDGMRVRYEVKDMALRISNVTPRAEEEGYVLFRASDDRNYEISIVFSYEQAEFLAEELYEANRRRREHSTSYTVDTDMVVDTDNKPYDEILNDMQ